MLLQRTARGFTLVELLVTVGIIATASAVLYPALAAGKAQIGEYSAMQAARQLGQAQHLYLADNDDSYPVAIWDAGSPKVQTWFGLVKKQGEVDTSSGALACYFNGKAPRDPMGPDKPFMGNGGGFGYNWYSIGSDTCLEHSESMYPNMKNPAKGSDLENPSNALIFASSAYVMAPWEAHGDGQAYDYGFVSPPKLWNYNPDIDFRHGGTRIVDVQRKEVRNNGRALVIFADGSVKTLKQDQVTDKMFQRLTPSPTAAPMDGTFGSEERIPEAGQRSQWYGGNRCNAAEKD